MSTLRSPWRRLDDPGAVYLTRDRVLRVEGRGARGWLNSLLTADLRSPNPDAARYALLLTPAGGIVSDLWVIECAAERSEKLALVLPWACAEQVHALLQKYLLNEEIRVEFDDAIRVVSLLGSKARELAGGSAPATPAYSCDRLGIEGIDVWVPAAEADCIVEGLAVAASRLGGGAIDAVEWSWARVSLGVPLAGVDFDEGTSPHEAGLEGRAVSFSKGCYIGQELVARQRRRGELRRRLVQLEIEEAGPVSERSTLRDLTGAEVGRLTSVAPARGEDRSLLALGYVAPPLAEVGTRVTLDLGAARVQRVAGRTATSRAERVAQAAGP
jgi:folate-binding protein YgfZ